MTRFMLLTGAAALAIGSAATATPQGKNDRSAKVERSDRQAAKSGKGDARRVEARAEKGRDRARVTFAKGRSDDRNERSMARVARSDRKAVRIDRDERRAVRIDRDERKVLRADRDDRRDGRIEQRFDRRDDRRVVRANTLWDDNDNRGGVWADGCPPGLAKKPVPCVPPGQVKNLVGAPLASAKQRLAMQQLPTSLRSLYRDDDDYYYRYGNGYVYKVDRDKQLIASLLPLFGLGQTVGQPFPSAYSNALLPAALKSFYPDSPYTTYRYANGYVYEIDPITGLIEDVDPMLGYGYGYGQMMPATYSAYNVPYQYRPLYQDSSDYYYRYAPGSIYRVDAGSGLIDSIAALLMPGGLSVGQPLPMGYDAYNVPFAYRDQYYDTPQNMYRYSNGYIYQVDPTTRLVTAIISALT